MSVPTIVQLLQIVVRGLYLNQDLIKSLKNKNWRWSTDFTPII